MTDRDDTGINAAGENIRWTRSAFRDLQNAHEYIRQHDPQAARQLARDVRRAVRRIADQPDSGPVAQDLEPAGAYRQVVVRPYRIIYLVDDGMIVVLRVWDARRDPGDMTIP